ncbi:MAG: leucine-rich repeat domain-containing protein, partial [Clostridia bacterium]|nr:leucine-rich repeat domain-containing protein [Clostridia bacterium]
MKKSNAIKLLVLILTFLACICFAVGCNNTPSGGNNSSNVQSDNSSVEEGNSSSSDIHVHFWEDATCSVCKLAAEEYFVFTLLEDGTYSIAAKAGNNIPAEIVIPSTYRGKAVTSIGWAAFRSCDSLTSVVIGDSVTSIGDHAFLDCESLTSVVIPDSVTSIGNYAFAGCGLTSVEIGDSVTSIGDYAFAYCNSLTRITVSEDNANFKDIDGNLYTKDGKTL